MKELTTRFNCAQCGRVETKWLGRCPDCGAWNSFQEEVVQKTTKADKTKIVSSPNKIQPIALSKVINGPDFRQTTGISELDRILGGGTMQGGSILLGGEPGIGKSTLMLQMLAGIKSKMCCMCPEKNPQDRSGCAQNDCN